MTDQEKARWFYIGFACGFIAAFGFIALLAWRYGH